MTPCCSITHLPETPSIRSSSSGFHAHHPRLAPNRNTPPAAAVDPLSMPRLILASTSPRRRRLLAEYGLSAEPIHPGLDDALLSPGKVSAAGWAAALAYLKASSATRNPAVSTPRPPAPGETVVIAADTVVVKNGRFIGQPRDAADAESIIRTLEGGEHEVVTGVCLLDPATNRRDVFTDRATVAVGRIGDGRIRDYIASGGWKGKAGAYNLAERLAEGWPIEYRGDPTTIMGLPMSILPVRLEAFAASYALQHAAGAATTDLPRR